jgi:hypothetical protein
MVVTLTNNNRNNVFFLASLLTTLSIQGAQAKSIDSVMHHTSQHYQEDVSYQLQWMNIPLGKATIHWKETVDSYYGSITIKTSGVARIFNTQERLLETNGRIERTATALRYIPQHYHNLVKYKKKSRDMTIDFDTQGVESSYGVTPAENRATRPEISNDLRDEALDILTAIMFAREKVAQSSASVQFHVFDARRLTSITLSRLPSAIVPSYLGSQKPVAGYTDKELKEAQDEAQNVTLEFATKDSLLPSRVFASTVLGTIEAVTTSRTVSSN